MADAKKKPTRKPSKARVDTDDDADLQRFEACIRQHFEAHKAFLGKLRAEYPQLVAEYLAISRLSQLAMKEAVSV